MKHHDALWLGGGRRWGRSRRNRGRR